MCKLLQFYSSWCDRISSTNRSRLICAQEQSRASECSGGSHCLVHKDANLTPEEIFETIESYAQACLRKWHSGWARRNEALGEWSQNTVYLISHCESNLAERQQSALLNALFSVLDHMYEQENKGLQAAFDLSSSAGVDYLFVRVSLVVTVL